MYGFPNLKESGAILIDGKHVASTTQCVHCGAHFMLVLGKGSGKKRFCLYCNGNVCLREVCKVCIPYEVKLDFQEARIANQVSMLKKITSKYPHIEALERLGF